MILCVFALSAGAFYFIHRSLFTVAAVEEAYRWRNDDGTETTATYAEAEGDPLSVPKNVPKRLRFAVANSGTESELVKKATLAFAGPGENLTNSSAIDAANGFAYFGLDGTGHTNGKIIKVRLSDFAQVGTISLAADQSYVDSAAIDPENGFAYFTSWSATVAGTINKIDLSTFTVVDTLVIPELTGNDFFSVNGDVDFANGFAYFPASGGSSGHLWLVKVDLSDFSEVSALAFPVGALTDTFQFLLDAENGYAYEGSWDTAPGRVTRVNLSSFTVDGTLTFAAGEDFVNGGAIDVANQLAYFGTYTAPGKIVKIDLSTFTRVGAITLNPGEVQPGVAVLDPDNGFVYFSTYLANPERIVKIDLSTFTRVGAITFGAGDNFALSAVFDASNAFGYVAMNTTPGKVVKFSVAPRASYRLEYGEKDSTCAAISSWTQVPSSATAEAWEMVDSADLTDGEATTNSIGLSDGNVSFKAGQAKDTGSETSSVSLGEKQFTELEYSVQATDDSVIDQDYCFRLTDAGSTSALTFASYAEATVVNPPRNSGGGAPPPVVTPAVSVTFPNGGETIAPGATRVTWTTQGRVDLVNLAYSADAGASWTAIATNVTNAGTYPWTVPDIHSSKALVRVEATDTATVFASDTSDSAFSISGAQTPPEGNLPPPPGPQQPVPAGTLVPSPFSGLPEAVDEVRVGDYVRSPHYRGIYYITDQFGRRPFSYASLFFTYENGLSKVREVSDATLSTLPVGNSMPPKTGTVLLRFDGEAGIYGVFPSQTTAVDPVLRRIDSEQVAVQTYGPAWKSYILELDNFAFTDYVLAAPVIASVPVDASTMFTSEYLHAKVTQYMAALMEAGYSSSGTLSQDPRHNGPHR